MPWKHCRRSSTERRAAGKNECVPPSDNIRRRFRKGRPGILMYSSGDIATTLVVPCYNEAGRLDTGAFAEFADSHPAIRFCFVNDGSTDGTRDVLERLASRLASRASVVTFDHNAGKAEAVRQGVLEALEQRGDLLGYWDADLATPLRELPRFVDILNNRPTVKMVMGARIMRLGARIKRHWWRHYPGRLYATLVSAWLLNLPAYDTQCGAKLLSRDCARLLFARPFVSKWLFDVEILLRLRTLYPRDLEQRVFELPLQEWRDIPGSKVSLSYCATVPLELARMRQHYGRDSGAVRD